MKTLTSFLSVLCLLSAVLLLPGCSSLPTDPTSPPATPAAMTPERVQRIARTAVWTTAVALTATKPARAVAFEKALVAVNKLVADQVWDITSISAALQTTGEQAFVGNEGRLILAGTTLLIDTIAGDKVDLKNVAYARAVLLGAQEGLRMALGGQ